MKLSRLGLLLAVVLGSVPAFADMLVDRGLPDTSNVNDGADRSNVNWRNIDFFVDPTTYRSVNGDDFVVSGGDWAINQISTWMVGDPTKYSNFVLYGAIANGVDPFVSIGIGAPTITKEYYQGANPAAACSVGGAGNPADYLGSGGQDCFPIYKVTFGVNLLLSEGTTFNFAPDAIPTVSSTCVNGGDESGCYYVHATNAALAGTLQQGSDNLYINYLLGDPVNFPDGAPLFYDSATDGSWDKSSDINVRVEGSVVPEPSTIPLILTGMVAIGLLRRRRK